MKTILQLYRYWNYLSLDVACGAMVCASFFSRIFNVQLRPYGLASLGITVWIIYTTDHLLDASKLMQAAASHRHQFHQKNFRKLSFALAIAILLDLVLVAFVRKPILDWGIVLAVIVLLYLLIQPKLTAFKEIAVSFLYSAGILLPTLSLTSITISGGGAVIIVSFVFTAFINLILFSWFDWEQDMLDHHSSFVTRLGKERTRKILRGVFLAQIVLFSGLILFSTYTLEALVLASMNIALFVLFMFPEKFSNHNLYRIIGDLVFVFPIPYLLLNAK